MRWAGHFVESENVKSKDGRVRRKGQEVSRAYLGDTKVLFFATWDGLKGVMENEGGEICWDPSVKGLEDRDFTS